MLARGFAVAPRILARLFAGALTCLRARVLTRPLAGAPACLRVGRPTRRLLARSFGNAITRWRAGPIMRGPRCALAGSRANLLAHWLGCVLACLRPIGLWWRPCRRACACPLACLRAGVLARNFAAALAGCRTRLLALACFSRSGLGAPACSRARLRGRRRVCALACWGACLLTRACWLASLMPRAWYRAGPVAQTCWPNGERWLACVLTCWRCRKLACWRVG